MYHHISHLPTDFLPSSTISRFSPFFFTIFWGGEFIISHQKGKGIFFSFFVYDSISSHGAPLCIGWNWVISLGELYLVVVVLLQPFGQFFGKLPPFYLLPSSYILYILCSLRLLPSKYRVWKFLKMSHLNFWIIYCPFLSYQKWPVW